MAVIDIGSPATNRASAFGTNYTFILLDNPADGTGILTSLEVWMAVTGDLTLATFSKNGDNFTPIAHVHVGTVIAGSKQTISISLPVNAGNYIGFFCSASGSVEADISGGAGAYYKSGDYTNSGEQTFTIATGRIGSVYCTGITVSFVPRIIYI